MSEEAKYFIITAYHKNLTAEENNILTESMYKELLYSDFNVISVDGIYENHFEKSFLCYSYDTSNDYMSAFTVKLLNKYKQKSAIIKYESKLNPNLIKNDGTTKKLKYKPYTDSKSNEGMTFIKDGLILCFEEEKEYKPITEKSQLSLGMIVEYMQNNTWYRALISDVEKDWTNKWENFAKYKKIRVAV